MHQKSPLTFLNIQNDEQVKIDIQQDYQKSTKTNMSEKFTDYCIFPDACAKKKFTRVFVPPPQAQMNAVLAVKFKIDLYATFASKLNSAPIAQNITTSQH